MPRYIDADELRDDIDNYNFTEYTDYSNVIDMIDDAPTADVEPVRHGRWNPVCNLMGEYFKCSECGQKADVPTCMGEPIFEYCPFCGAKMDGGVKVEKQQAETDNDSETG